MLVSNGNAKMNAIVIGASMAGLMAARVLADHFERVTLLERDKFPAVGENRKGVPQGKHTHILLERGRAVMENYFPWLTDELKGQGAVIIDDASADMRWFHSGGYHQAGTSSVSGVGVSRPTLEGLMRKRVLALPSVEAIQNCNVLGLASSPDNARVTGVNLERRTANQGTETLPADLVVDASGRGSRSPSWLEALGYERPPEEEVRIDLGYTTCYYRREPDHIPGLQGIVLLATPPNKRLGVLVAQDGNRWVLTVGGYLGEHAPTGYPEFLNAVRQLPSPDIYRVVKDTEPLGEPVAYTFPSNLRRRYDKLSAFPQGYLVIGDAQCSFNPIYGQGMTVAALESVALDDCLEEGDLCDAQLFFGATKKIVDQSWDTAVGNDLGYAEIVGPRTPFTRFLNWYGGKLHVAAHNDAAVSIAFLKVINMVAPPTTLMRPGMIWRVFKGNVQTSRRDGVASREQPLPSSGSTIAKG